MNEPRNARGPVADGDTFDSIANATVAPSSAKHRYAPYRKTGRINGPRRPRLDTPLTIARWSKNRRGHVVVLILENYQDTNVVDLRTWLNSDEGKALPGKGFCCGVNHLPRLAEEFAKARDKAIELGLIDGVKI